MMMGRWQCALCSRGQCPTVWQGGGAVRPCGVKPLQHVVYWRLGMLRGPWRLEVMMLMAMEGVSEARGERFVWGVMYGTPWHQVREEPIARLAAYLW